MAWFTQLIFWWTFLLWCSARWIGNHGFSIGIDDVQPKDKLIKGKEETIDDGYKKCDGFIEAFNSGKLELLPGCDAAQTLESKIFGTLNGLRDTTGKVIHYFSESMMSLYFDMLATE
jgi:DNA-directed RNA polymerase beta' subunit